MDNTTFNKIFKQRDFNVLGSVGDGSFYLYKMLRAPIQDFYENFKIVVQCVMALITISDVRNLSPTVFISIVNQELSRSTYQGLSARKVYVCMVFLAHIVFAISSTLFFELVSVTFKWIICWCLISLMWSKFRPDVQKTNVMDVNSIDDDKIKNE